MKIKHFLPLLLLLGSNEMLTAQEIALTPQPAHLTVKDGRFEFGNQLKAKVAPYQGDSIRMVFESFKKELQEATGIKVSSTQKEAKATDAPQRNGRRSNVRPFTMESPICRD